MKNDFKKDLIQLLIENGVGPRILNLVMKFFDQRSRSLRFEVMVYRDPRQMPHLEEIKKKKRMAGCHDLAKLLADIVKCEADVRDDYLIFIYSIGLLVDYSED